MDLFNISVFFVHSPKARRRWESFVTSKEHEKNTIQKFSFLMKQSFKYSFLKIH